MADGSLVSANRENPTPSGSTQAIETIEQDRAGAGVKLLQTITAICVTGLTPAHNPKGVAGAPVAVTNASTAVADANEKRLVQFITNMGNQIVYLKFDGTSATTYGHPLYPSQTFVNTWFCNAINAITSAATPVCNVHVSEISLP